MLALIQNENMKIFRRVPTWIMLGLLVVIIFTGAILQKVNSDDEQANANWKGDLQQQNAQYEQTIKDKDAPAFIVANSKKNLALNQYRLDHDLDPNVDGAWENVINNVAIINVVTLFTIIIAGGSVASEFSWGTIKLLLIRPVSRSKVLFAKYISTFTFALITLILLFGLSFAVGAIFFGTDTIGTPHLAYHDGKVIETSMFIHAIQVYGLACVGLLMMVTFAFMVGTIFRNSSLSIGLAIFLMFMGAQGTQVIALKFDWAKYILFANMDLTRYIDGVPLVEGMTMTFSVVMLVVYFVVFNGLTWMIFNKRDVAA
ncbi:ABC transporter permease [Bacillus sp. FJAT-29814]|uniref:ABC transporter permease n=1 Tax=Bacillus sp. FJAT-29814 TaxID=1729688 RepID=UPI003462EC36